MSSGLPEACRFALRQLANVGIDGAVTEPVVEPECAALECLGVITPELVGVGDEPRTSAKVVVDPHDLGPDEGGLGAPEVVEDIDSGVDLVEQDARTAVADGHAVSEYEKAHRGLQRETMPRQQAEDRDANATARVGQVHLARVGVVEVIGLAIANRECRHRGVDQARAAAHREWLERRQRAHDFLLRCAWSGAHTGCAYL